MPDLREKKGRETLKTGQTDWGSRGMAGPVRVVQRGDAAAPGDRLDRLEGQLRQMEASQTEMMRAVHALKTPALGRTEEIPAEDETDNLRVVSATDTRWLCSSCSSLLGILDGIESILRIRSRDMTVYMRLLPGCFVRQVCRTCGSLQEIAIETSHE